MKTAVKQAWLGLQLFAVLAVAYLMIERYMHDSIEAVATVEKSSLPIADILTNVESNDSLHSVDQRLIAIQSLIKDALIRMEEDLTVINERVERLEFESSGLVSTADGQNYLTAEQKQKIEEEHREQERLEGETRLNEAQAKLADPQDTDPDWTPVIKEKIDVAFNENPVLQQAQNYQSHCVSDLCKISVELPKSLTGTELNVFDWTLLQAFSRDFPSTFGGRKKLPNGQVGIEYYFSRRKE